MPLSSVIENTTQSVFPLLQRCGIVEPVFPERGKYVIVHHGFHPFVGAFLLVAEIAVPDAEARTQRRVLQYDAIQFINKDDSYTCKIDNADVVLMDEEYGNLIPYSELEDDIDFSKLDSESEVEY